MRTATPPALSRPFCPSPSPVAAQLPGLPRRGPGGADAAPSPARHPVGHPVSHPTQHPTARRPLLAWALGWAAAFSLQAAPVLAAADPMPAASASAAAALPALAVLPTLPALGLATGQTTVSGLSSGAYMAGQYHIAFSSSLAGAAILAGGPYGCSNGSVSTAMTLCSCPGPDNPLQQLNPLTRCATTIPTASLTQRAISAVRANRAHLDPASHLARQRVWLFTGGQDQVVPSGLVDAVQGFYLAQGVPASAIHYERVGQSAHGLPAPNGPVACDTTASPYITRCRQEDAAGELLSWLYAVPGQPTWQPGQARPQGLQRFDQRPYRQAGTWDGLDDSGWLYVPQACAATAAPAAADAASGAASPASCRLHIVFHGCGQGQSKIGRTFVDGAGYNRWAEANRVVLLYPQVLASDIALADKLRGKTYQLNPAGCWDFWGYSDPKGDLGGIERRYARRSAPQLAAVKRMADALLQSRAGAAGR